MLRRVPLTALAAVALLTAALGLLACGDAEEDVADLQERAATCEESVPFRFAKGTPALEVVPAGPAARERVAEVIPEQFEGAEELFETFEVRSQGEIVGAVVAITIGTDQEDREEALAGFESGAEADPEAIELPSGAEAQLYELGGATSIVTFTDCRLVQVAAREEATAFAALELLES